MEVQGSAEDEEYTIPTFAELRKQFAAEARRKILLPISFACVILGSSLAYGLKFAFKSYNIKLSEDVKLYITFPGEMLNRMLQLVTLPLLLIGAFKGITLTEFPAEKAVRTRIGFFWFLTTVQAILLGTFVMLYLSPGSFFIVNKASYAEVFNGPAIMNLIINFAPENLISACIEKPRMVYSFHTDLTNLTDEEIEPPQEGFNTLSILLVSSIYGLIMRKAGRAHTFVMVVADIYEVIKFWIEVVLRYMPLGLISFCLHRILVDDESLPFKRFGIFSLLTAGTILAYGLVIQPFTYIFMTGHSPILAVKRIFPALMAALLTSSSACTFPITAHCLKMNHFNGDVVDSLLPVLNRICKDGTTIYNVMAILFISEINGILLSLILLFQIIVTVVALSVRNPGPAELGVFTTILILSAMHLPVRDCILLVLVEWIIDRLNKAVDVMKQVYCIALAQELISIERKT